MSSTSNSDTLPFDEVFLEVEGKQKRISVAVFFALPLSDRVRHVIERRVTFWAGGVLLEQKEALAAIRRYRAAVAAP
jgi:hypothetical protein